MAGETTKVYRTQGADRLVIASGGTMEIQTGGNVSGRQFRNSARSTVFDIDNGAGTTIDTVIMRPPGAITISHARIVYVEETTGTVAAANVKIGTTLGGAEIVAATAYANSQAVGAISAMTIVNGAVPGNTSIFVRHTGIAATAAGKAFVEIFYTTD